MGGMFRKIMNNMQVKDVFVVPLQMRVPNSVVSDYAVAEGVDAIQAARRAAELEKFLYVASISEVPLIPSPAIDSIWHDFILHTQDYGRFCAINFGRFIHHLPDRSGSR